MVEKKKIYNIIKELLGLVKSEVKTLDICIKLLRLINEDNPEAIQTVVECVKHEKWLDGLKVLNHIHHDFKVGDCVKINTKVGYLSQWPNVNSNETAHIKTLMSTIEGGVSLTKELCGSYYWNVRELEKVS